MPRSQFRSLWASVPRPLRLFWIVYIAYTALAWAVCGWHFLHGDPQAYSSPFIHKAADPFTDLRTYTARFRLFHTPAFFAPSSDYRLPYFAYPATASLVYWLFYHLPHTTLMYLALATAWICALTVGLASVLARQGWPRLAAWSAAVLTAALSFPLDFMLERGNIELVVWMLLFVGLFCWLRGRSSLAAAFLGAAAAIKWVPIVFCGVLFRRRTLSSFALAVLSVVAITAFALWFAGPSMVSAFHGFNGTVSSFQANYSAVVRSEEIGLDHSLFALVKVLGLAAHREISAWLPRYYLLAGSVALGLFLFRAVHLPILNRLLFLTTMALLLPPTSAAYTLVYLYAPWLLLVLASLHMDRAPEIATQYRLSVLLLCFVPLLAPFSLFVVHGQRYGGQVQTVALLVLLVLALCWPVSDALWRDALKLPEHG
ncbi:MAG TPA: glycosyltransferase family 87 protein [Acidobacteriaceae bacterium]|jgi:hypothetical protein|nr:glycosyltransferase family 87 protein [Acidobacteriaceae bacterium]